MIEMRRTLLVIVMTASLAACSSQSTATLSGQVTLLGGTAGTGGKPAASGAPASHIAVAVSGTAGLTKLTTTNGDGRFGFHLAPGRYTVQECGRVTPVTITEGHTTTENLACPVS